MILPLNVWGISIKKLQKEAEDAILNGEDVSGLDLLTTELVVLSACETGLGEVKVFSGCGALSHLQVPRRW